MTAFRQAVGKYASNCWSLLTVANLLYPPTKQDKAIAQG